MPFETSAYRTPSNVSSACGAAGSIASASTSVGELERVAADVARLAVGEDQHGRSLGREPDHLRGPAGEASAVAVDRQPAVRPDRQTPAVVDRRAVVERAAPREPRRDRALVVERRVPRSRGRRPSSTTRPRRPRGTAPAPRRSHRRSRRSVRARPRAAAASRDRGRTWRSCPSGPNKPVGGERGERPPAAAATDLPEQLVAAVRVRVAPTLAGTRSPRAPGCRPSRRRCRSSGRPAGAVAARPDRGRGLPPCDGQVADLNRVAPRGKVRRRTSTPGRPSRGAPSSTSDARTRRRTASRAIRRRSATPRQRLAGVGVRQAFDREVVDRAVPDDGDEPAGRIEDGALTCARR